MPNKKHIIYLGRRPLVKMYGDSGSGDAMAMPSYFITHGRIGTCIPSNLTSLTVLKAMGYKCINVGGTVAGTNHDWSEVEIDGTIYVESNGFLYPRESLYESESWVPVDSYNPDWYKYPVMNRLKYKSALNQHERKKKETTRFTTRSSLRLPSGANADANQR